MLLTGAFKCQHDPHVHQTDEIHYAAVQFASTQPDSVNSNFNRSQRERDQDESVYIPPLMSAVLEGEQLVTQENCS